MGWNISQSWSVCLERCTKICQQYCQLVLEPFILTTQPKSSAWHIPQTWILLHLHWGIAYHKVREILLWEQWNLVSASLITSKLLHSMCLLHACRNWARQQSVQRQRNLILGGKVLQWTNILISLAWVWISLLWLLKVRRSQQIPACPVRGKISYYWTRYTCAKVAWT